ncbi:PspA/IM30 family protein [Peribacillus alkalitolerans]|uniref:PspA/IM30 family protein n=1 Tax=Peribacillus alkalitolerans TaxID=1550385 RepID=UPI0013CFEE6A|nr:PspA/IM30 family protein [Peribacillus alkalitolerans]
MFELFKRVKTVVNAELHSLIDKAENPIHMLHEYLRQMSVEIKEAEKATAKVIANEKLLSKKLSDLNEIITKRKEQAIEALTNNREDLAKRALEDKTKIMNEMNELVEQHDTTLQHATDLKAKLKIMKDEYREMEIKLDSLKARQNVAKARASINHALTSINQGNAKNDFKRMEEKVIQFEAEAGASEDLQVVSQSLDQEISELSGKNQVDLELEELKKQLIKNEDTN